MSTRGPLLPRRRRRRSERTFVIVFAAGRWRAGAGPAILCGRNFGLGTSRPSAAPGLQQPAARNSRAPGGGRKETNSRDVFPFPVLHFKSRTYKTISPQSPLVAASFLLWNYLASLFFTRKVYIFHVYCII